MLTVCVCQWRIHNWYCGLKCDEKCKRTRYVVYFDDIFCWWMLSIPSRVGHATGLDETSDQRKKYIYILRIVEIRPRFNRGGYANVVSFFYVWMCKMWRIRERIWIISSFLNLFLLHKMFFDIFLFLAAILFLFRFNFCFCSRLRLSSVLYGARSFLPLPPIFLQT